MTNRRRFQSAGAERATPTPKCKRQCQRRRRRRRRWRAPAPAPTPCSCSGTFKKDPSRCGGQVRGAGSRCRSRFSSGFASFSGGFGGRRNRLGAGDADETDAAVVAVGGGELEAAGEEAIARLWKRARARGEQAAQALRI